MENNLEVEDQAADGKPKRPPKILPFKDPREFLTDTNRLPTDEDLVKISQAMMLELAGEARASLDLTRASGVMALKDVIKAVSDISQTQIKNRQDAQLGAGQLANGAQIVAAVLKSINRPDETSFTASQPAPDYVPPAPDLGPDDDISDQAMTRGVENLREDEFLQSKPIPD